MLEIGQTEFYRIPEEKSINKCDEETETSLSHLLSFLGRNAIIRNIFSAAAVEMEEVYETRRCLLPENKAIKNISFVSARSTQ